MRIESREYQKAIDYLCGLVKTGELKIGSKLPAERKLAETLSIGRNSTREALRMLENMGVIECRRGSGNYIAGNMSQTISQMIEMMLWLRQVSREEIIMFRRDLEKAVCSCIITNGSIEKWYDKIMLAIEMEQRLKLSKSNSMEQNNAKSNSMEQNNAKLNSMEQNNAKLNSMEQNNAKLNSIEQNNVKSESAEQKKTKSEFLRTKISNQETMEQEILKWNSFRREIFTSEVLEPVFLNKQIEADWNFHHTLVLATENKLWIWISEAMMEIRQHWIEAVLTHADSDTKCRLKKCHEEIFLALKDGSMEAVQKAVDRHYDLVDRELINCGNVLQDDTV